MVMARRVPARAPVSFRLARTPKRARLVSTDCPKVAEVEAVLTMDSCRSVKARLVLFMAAVKASLRCVAPESGCW
jgi:hypothetical protein